jgi:hypothetical protein
VGEVLSLLVTAAAVWLAFGWLKYRETRTKRLRATSSWAMLNPVSLTQLWKIATLSQGMPEASGQQRESRQKYQLPEASDEPPNKPGIVDWLKDYIAQEKGKTPDPER